MRKLEKKPGGMLKAVGSRLPRVLVAAPTSDRHSYCIKQWMKAVDKIDYDKDRYAVLLVDTSLKKGKYGQMLRKWGARVIDHEWKPKKQHPIQMLADAREKYRKLAWEKKFDYILHLDTDVIFPRSGLKRLLAHNKDQVGFVVHAFYTKTAFKRMKMQGPYSRVASQPMVMRSGFINNLGRGRWKYDYYSWKEIEKMKKLKQPVRVFASSIACLLVKKKAYSSVPFRTHPNFVYGEDMWYYSEADERGFEAYVDAKVRCEHLNFHWGHASKSKPQLGFAIGLADVIHPVWDDIEKEIRAKKIDAVVGEVQ